MDMKKPPVKTRGVPGARLDGSDLRAEARKAIR